MIHPVGDGDLRRSSVRARRIGDRSVVELRPTSACTDSWRGMAGEAENRATAECMYVLLRTRMKRPIVAWGAAR